MDSEDPKVRAFTRGGKCPCCGAEIEVQMDVAVVFAKRRTPIEDWMRQLHSEDRELLEHAARVGLLSVFATVLTERYKPAVPPKNTGKTFLEWLRQMREWNLASMPGVRLTLMSQFQGADLKVYEHLKIAAVFCDGIMRIIVPADYLRVPAVKAALRIGDVQQTGERLSGWIKTRNGYVPEEARTFLSQINQRNPGAFANLGNL